VGWVEGGLGVKRGMNWWLDWGVGGVNGRAGGGVNGAGRGCVQWYVEGDVVRSRCVVRGVESHLNARCGVEAIARRFGSDSKFGLEARRVRPETDRKEERIMSGGLSGESAEGRNESYEYSRPPRR